MIVKGNEVTLTKEELKDVIIECSAKVASETDIDDFLFVLMQGMITSAVVTAVSKKIFGEKK